MSITLKQIYFPNLRNDEIRTFHCDGLNYAKRITVESLQGKIATYEKVTQEYIEYLKASPEEELGKKTKELDIKRNEAYVACRRIAQGLKKFPGNSEEVVKVAATISEIFQKAPAIYSLNQSQSTGVIEDLIEGCNALNEEAIAACGFKVYLENLKEANANFIEAFRARNEARSRHTSAKGLQLRKELEKAYKDLAIGIEGFASIGDAGCIEFINNLNGTIEAKSEAVKVRKKAKEAQKTGNKDSNVEKVASNAAI